MAAAPAQKNTGVSPAEEKHKNDVSGVGIGPYKIPTSLYANNRRRLIERLAALGEDVVKESAVVLQGGGDMMRYDTDHEMLFRNESNFLFLFGLNEPSCYGIVDLPAKESLIFIPRRDKTYEIFCGKDKTPEEYKAAYGVDHVHFVDELSDVLHKRGLKKLHVTYGKNTDSGAFAQPATFKGIEAFEVDQDVLYPELVECRVIKSEEELNVLRYITGISSDAHIDVMKKVKPGMREYQLESLFRHYTQYYGGSRYLAYTCICGAGHHGATLHYGHAGAPNDGTLKSNDMLLLDMGSEYQGYCSDITCSYPASGKFTPDQKAIYDAVLASQLAVMKAMKPGVLWTDMHKLSLRVILEHLIQLGLVMPKGKTPDELVELHIGAVFMPHGLGHFIGLDTHDVGGYPKGAVRDMQPSLRYLRTQRKLEKNMCITIEPGCYFIDALLDAALQDPVQAPHINNEVLQRFRGFGGVRIEDDVIVTADGCENMTKCPRTTEEIEAVMASGSKDSQ